MSDWKDHPALIAIASGCTVLTVSFALIFNYIIPVMKEADQNKIKSLTSEIQQKNNEIKKLSANNLVIIEKNYKIKSLEENISQRIDEANELKLWFFDYTLKNSYSFNSPYPTGYAKIRPHDTMEQFLEVYKTPQIQASSGGNYYTIEPDNTYIESLVYYFDENNERVTHILFNVRTGRKEFDKMKVGAFASDLKDVLQHSLGVGKTCHNGNYLYWISPDKKFVTYFRSELSYVVMDSNLHNIAIPIDCRKQIYLEVKSVR